VSDRVGVGIIGTGFAAQRRAAAVAEEPRAELVAVASRNPAAAATFVETYPARALAIAELLALPELDLVVVCTVNSEHGRLARAALEAGKHVAVEYPLALDPAEARELVALARTRGLLLHVEHIELLGGLHAAIREHLAEIAPIFYARYATISPQTPAPRRWTFQREAFGFPFSGALSRVHRCTDLFGTVASVTGQSRWWDVGEGYYRAVLCMAQVRFANGILAELVYGRGEAFGQAQRRFELHGENGTLAFAGDRGQLLRGESATDIPTAGRRGLFARDTVAVLDYLLDGTPLYVDVAASCYASEVAEAIRQAAASGQTVALPSRDRPTTL